MKNAYVKDILRTIRKSAKRFLAITAITALGLTAFAGITAACKDMYLAADRFYDEQRLFDIRVLSTLGLTDGDVAALQGVGGVAVADGAYGEAVHTWVDGLRQSAEVVMLSGGGLNLPYVMEGALPQHPGEIAVTQKYLDETGKAVGDTLTIEEELEDTEADAGPKAAAEPAPARGKGRTAQAKEADGAASADETGGLDLALDWDAEIAIEEEPERPNFLNTEYSITAVVLDPMDIANNEGTTAFRSTATTDYTFFVTAADVDTDVYTSVYLTLHGLEGLDCYSDEYVQTVQAVIHRIEAEIMRQRQQARYDGVIAEALEKIGDAEATMDEQFGEADEQFAQAWADIEAAKQELSEGEAELTREERSALQQLADARTELEDGKRRLAEAEAALPGALEQLQAGQASYEAGLAQYNTGLAEYNTARADMEALAQGVGSLPGIPQNVLRPLLDAYGAELQGSPEHIGQFSAAVDGITGVLDGMAAFFTEAGQAGPATLIGGLSANITGALALAQNDPDTDFEVVYGAVMALFSALPPEAGGVVPYDMMTDATAAALAEMDAAKAKLDAGWAELQSGKAELDEGWAQYHDGVAQLQAARAELQAGEDELNAEEQKARRELADAWREIAEGRQELAEGEAELLENLEQYHEKKAEAEALLADAYAELADIDMAQWYVQDRTAIDSYSGLDSDLGSIDAIGRAFPILFLVVAVLISLTTMTRMVEEERGLIGTYKALGFGNLAIASKYLLYALLASLAGSVVGNVLGFVVLPKLLILILRAIYILPAVPLHFDIPYALLGMLLFMLSIVVATAMACRSELRRVPAALMRPKAPRAGSRILLERVGPVWNRLKFLNKVTARNLFRYKKRLVMTVVGIAGCTALVLAGFAIRDSVTDLMPKQYEHIYRYDLMVVADEADNEKLLRHLESDANVADFLSVRLESAKILNADGDSESLQMVVVPEGAALEDYVATPGKNGGQAAPGTAGVLVTQNAAGLLGLRAGDTITLQNLQLDRYDTTVQAVVENYLGNSVYISQPLYEALFGPYEPNAAYAHLAPGVADQAAYAERLLDEDFILSSVSTQALKQQFTTDFAILNYVIYLLIILAAGLALVVLFTLSNTNISERVRELATIKVLGFFDREVHTYVNRETLILTLIGVVAGLPLGYALSGLLLAALKMPALEFALTINAPSYLIAAVISLCFALVVNLITNRVLDKINMVEALKSVE